MNIVIINHYAGGPHLGMEFRPFYLAKQWQSQGHNVLIVGASFSHLRAKQPVVEKITKNEAYDGVNYLWIKTNPYAGNGLGRIISMFLFTWRAYTQLRRYLRSFQPNLIIASSTYPLDNVSAFSLARKYRALYCYEVHDLWPLSPMELGGYSKYHPFILMMQWAENFAYRRCDFVVSMLPKTLEHMIKHGLSPEKFVYVPNGVNVDEWRTNTTASGHEDFIRKLRLEKDVVVVGYTGGHAISNALEYLVDAAVLASDAAPYLRFLLIGSGNEKNTLIRKAEALKLSNISFLPPVPKSCIPQLLQKMDILYLGWHRNPLYRFGISPNKLLDYMMAGKPIVHSVSAANDIVREAGCGLSVEPEDPKKIVEALITISKMSEHEKNRMGMLGLEFAKSHFSYEKLSRDFISIATDIQGRKREGSL